MYWFCGFALRADDVSPCKRASWRPPPSSWRAARANPLDSARSKGRARPL